MIFTAQIWPGSTTAYLTTPNPPKIITCYLPSPSLS